MGNFARWAASPCLANLRSPTGSLFRFMAGAATILGITLKQYDTDALGLRTMLTEAKHTFLRFAIDIDL
jgi:hypothetical protein